MRLWVALFFAVAAISVFPVPGNADGRSGFTQCASQEIAKSCKHCFGRDNPKQVQKCMRNCQAGTGGRKK